MTPNPHVRGQGHPGLQVRPPPHQHLRHGLVPTHGRVVEGGHVVAAPHVDRKHALNDQSLNDVDANIFPGDRLVN